MRVTWVRVFLAAGVAAFTAVATMLAAPAVAGAAVFRPMPLRHTAASDKPAPGDLYFVAGGYIVRVPVSGGAPKRVVRVGDVSVTGMAIADGRLFWVTLTGADDSLSYVGLKGTSQAHTLVGNLPFPVGLVAADGWLYWADQSAIGRVRPDGARLSRQFIKLPQETGGGVADGLATDGHHLFFSRCQDNEIGRVNFGGGGMAFIHLPRGSCPQGLAVGSDELYWAELGGYVGRATLHGTHIGTKWLSIHTSQGPFNLAADRDDIYWDWGGVAGSPEHVGRARVSGRGLDSSIFLGQGAFLLTSPGANA
jgi:streptogramin lyase